MSSWDFEDTTIPMFYEYNHRYLLWICDILLFLPETEVHVIAVF